MADEFKVGDKVTVYNGRGIGQKPIAITVVREIGKRFFRTGDDRRWQVKGIFRNEVNARGTEISRCHVQPYKAGDEERVARQHLLDNARNIFELEWYISLLHNSDLALLGGVAKRLDALKKEHIAKKLDDA